LAAHKTAYGKVMKFGTLNGLGIDPFSYAEKQKLVKLHVRHFDWISK